MFLAATVMQINKCFYSNITVQVPPLNYLTNLFILTEGENVHAVIYVGFF